MVKRQSLRGMGLVASVILAAGACQAAAPSSPPASVAASTGTGASSAPASQAAQGTKFKGVNVNILTFNGPQVAEPLQRRAPDWEQLTGGHVNVIAVGFQTIYDKALLDASTGTNARELRLGVPVSSVPRAPVGELRRHPAIVALAAQALQNPMS